MNAPHLVLQPPATTFELQCIRRCMVRSSFRGQFCSYFVHYMYVYSLVKYICEK